MTTLPDPILNEVFVEWPAWQTVVERLLPVGTDAREASPADVSRALGEMNGEALRRLTHLLVANAQADTLYEATVLLGRLWGLAIVGKRPRFGNECGLSGDDFREAT